MAPSVVGLWLLNMALDTLGQMAFKAAASDHRAGDGTARWRYMLARPWIWVGILSYVIEFLVWVAFVSLVDLSVGVLLGSFDIVAIMLAGRWFFREKLTPLRIAGGLLVAVGVVIVGLTGGG